MVDTGVDWPLPSPLPPENTVMPEVKTNFDKVKIVKNSLKDLTLAYTRPWIKSSLLRTKLTKF